jgi:uncharacterized protein YdeI (YjbR/CyaY-like superfamily)
MHRRRQSIERPAPLRRRSGPVSDAPTPVAKARFFAKPADFRAWLERHHRRAQELLVGFHKSDSGRRCMSWPESVDEALCFGWIDGVRKRLDDARYTIRFTPRRAGSIWSAVNIRRARALIDAGRMRPSGLEQFAARSENKSGIYSYEQRPKDLPEPYAGMLARDAAARRFFEGRAPSYRRAAIWWVISAKKDATRLERARSLIVLSAKGRLIPQFIRRAPAGAANAADESA